MRSNTHSLTSVAVMTALLSVLAPLVIPVGPIPLSLATLILSLYLFIFPKKEVLCATALYLALGTVGVPVFSGFSGGFSRLAGPTGGYLLGYLLFVLLGSSLISLSKGNKLLSALSLLGATLLLYGVGTFWFSLITSSSPVGAISLCVFPFIPGDILKIILTLLLAPPIKKALKRK